MQTLEPASISSSCEMTAVTASTSAISLRWATSSAARWYHSAGGRGGSLGQTIRASMSAWQQQSIHSPCKIRIHGFGAMRSRSSGRFRDEPVMGEQAT
jgi:hypothetical protein